MLVGCIVTGFESFNQDHFYGKSLCLAKNATFQTSNIVCNYYIHAKYPIVDAFKDINQLHENMDFNKNTGFI